MYAKKLAILAMAMAVSLAGCVGSRVVHKTHRGRHAGPELVLLSHRPTPRLFKQPGEKRHGDAKPPRHKVEHKRSQPQRPNELIRPTKPQIHKRPKPQSREEQAEPRKPRQIKPTKKDTEANRRKEKPKAGKREGIAKRKARNDKAVALELRPGR